MDTRPNYLTFPFGSLNSSAISNWRKHAITDSEWDWKWYTRSRNYSTRITFIYKLATAETSHALLFKLFICVLLDFLCAQFVASLWMRMCERFLYRFASLYGLVILIQSIYYYTRTSFCHIFKMMTFRF